MVLVQRRACVRACVYTSTTSGISEMLGYNNQKETRGQDLGSIEGC